MNGKNHLLNLASESVGFSATLLLHFVRQFWVCSWTLLLRSKLTLDTHYSGLYSLISDYKESPVRVSKVGALASRVDILY